MLVSVGLMDSKHYFKTYFNCGRLFHSQHPDRLLTGREVRDIGKPDQAKHTMHRGRPHPKNPRYGGFRGFPGVCCLRLQWLGSPVGIGTGKRMTPNRSIRLVRVSSRARRIGSSEPSVCAWRPPRRRFYWPVVFPSGGFCSYKSPYRAGSQPLQAFGGIGSACSKCQRRTAALECRYALVYSRSKTLQRLVSCNMLHFAY
jgi:hypothetical protein